MSSDQDAFARAKRAWETLNEVWERGDQHTPAGRRALHGLKEALEPLGDLMRDPKTEFYPPVRFADTETRGEG